MKKIILLAMPMLALTGCGDEAAKAKNQKQYDERVELKPTSKD